MHKNYRDYYWKNGYPYGLEVEKGDLKGITFKIVTDPYWKRVTIERYVDGKFVRLDYDSQLLDFRKLKPENQSQWQRETLEEGPDRIVSLIRDQDDRVILKEELKFQGDLCRECLVSTPNNQQISVHRMFYKLLQETFDGVVLYDNNEKVVMKKSYAFDETVQEFTEMLKEEWDFTHA